MDAPTDGAVGVPEFLEACLSDISCAAPPTFGDRPLALDNLIDALRFHHIPSILATQIRPMTQLPTAVKEAVEVAHLTNSLRQLRYLADLRNLAVLLDGIAVPWIVVKGPAVAQSWFPNRLLRDYLDVDVLVPRQRLGEVLDALESYGAVLVDRNWPLIAQQMRGELSWALPGGTLLDLHWALVNDRRKRAIFRLPTDEFLARARTLTSGNIAFRAGSAEDQLIHVAIHALLGGGHRLSWLKDLQLAAAAGPDWDAVVERSRRWRVAGPVAVMLGRAVDVLGAPVPPAVTRSLLPGLGWRQLAALATRKFPPSESHVRGVTGIQIVWSARDSRLRSVAALGLGLAHKVLDRPGVPLEVHDPIHEEVPDPDARRAYLTRLAGATSP